MAKVKVGRVAERAVTESKGRLTTTDAPAHERRRGLANPLEDCALMLETMIRNWPAEYELPKGHSVFHLIKLMRTVAAGLVTAPNNNDDDDVLDLI